MLFVVKLLDTPCKAWHDFKYVFLFKFVQMHPGIPHFSLIISPLRCLIRDQVQRWNKRGVSAVALISGDDLSSETLKGMFNNILNFVF